jgi:hypothetical protein
VSDIYVFRPGDSPQWRAQRAAEQAQRTGIRERWIDRVTQTLAIDAATVRRVVTTLFDHPATDGECSCSCHPRFELTHDGGFDCPCTWSAERREQVRAAWLEDAPWREELREAADREQRELEAWLSGEPGVTARRTCFAAPEIWEGAIDGRSFFFRERHGQWRIEIDLAPDGRFAERLTGVGSDGELQTEPVELTSGIEIASGLDEDLGGTAVEHLAFVVETVRAHLRAESCRHEDARAYCPDCGRPVAAG